MFGLDTNTKLKAALKATAVSNYQTFRNEKNFILTDSSKTELREVLRQNHDVNNFTVAFASRATTYMRKSIRFFRLYALDKFRLYRVYLEHREFQAIHTY